MDTMHGSAIERVLAAELDGGVVDVTVDEDEEIPGVVIVFIDTPGRAVRVVVNEAMIGVFA